MRVNRIILYITLTILGACSNGHFPEEIDFQGEKIKGNVKYLSLTRYKAEEIKSKAVKIDSDNGYKKYLAHFGKKKTIKAFYLYGFGDEITNKKTYQYDNKGNCIEEAIYKDVDKLFAKKISVYNEQNQITQEFTISGDLVETFGMTEESEKILADLEQNITGRYIYSYDENEFLTQTDRVNNEEVVMSFFYKNNTLGEPENVTIISKNDSIQKIMECTYDEDNNCISKTYKNGNDSIEKRVTIEYDKLGNKINEIVYNTDSTLSRAIKYNISGKIIEALDYNRSGEITDRENYLYNEQDMMIGSYIDNTFHKKETKKIKYYYDSKGNWIEKVVYNENDKPISIFERNIIYYRIIDIEIEPF